MNVTSIDSAPRDAPHAPTSISPRPGGATGPVEQGAAGIVWAATLPDTGPTGGLLPRRPTTGLVDGAGPVRPWKGQARGGERAEQRQRRPGEVEPACVRCILT